MGHPTGSFNAFEPTLRRALALAPERRTVTAVLDSGRPAPHGKQEVEHRNSPGPESVNLTKTIEADGLREQADAEPAPATRPTRSCGDARAQLPVGSDACT
ncbi:hypothetical protein ACFWVP_19320 [Streptomyces sp. NPDC058637]|uniref:hypothetical protein n=1 Tax=Streptomyces sp. NPDC058637 TaxID=3346569 RepID=UPI00365415D1